MRNVVTKVVVGMAIAAIGMFGADNSIGTWKRNIAKSKGTGAVASPIKSLTLVYEPAEGGSKLTATGERQDGTKIDSTSTVKYDGKEYPVTGANWDTTSVKQIDAGVPAEVLARLVVPLAARGVAGVVEDLRDPVAVGVARAEGGGTAGRADRIDPVGGRRHIAQARSPRRRSRRETVENLWCCGEAEQERQGRGQHCFPHGASTPFPARTRRS